VLVSFFMFMGRTPVYTLPATCAALPFSFISAGITKLPTSPPPPRHTVALFRLRVRGWDTDRGGTYATSPSPLFSPS